MHVLITNFNGNPNLGVYGLATDEYCLLSTEITKKNVNEIKKVLKVPTYQIRIAGTSLIGALCAGNSKCLLVPEIIFDAEKQVLDKLGIKYKVIETDLTALGNNILANDNGCLVNPEFSADQKKEIRKALQVPLKPGTIAGLNIVGSCASLNKKGCLIHRDASDSEIKYIEDLLKIKCQSGSVNMGSPYASSGVLCNSNGFLIGDTSGGPEISNADEALGFI